jgi:lipopolysaccharide heptosyltransferase II
MNILLVRLRLIGDVVFTTPAIRAIRRHFPNAKISYIVEEEAAAVVRSNPHLDEVIVAASPHAAGRLRADLALVRRLRAGRYDLAIDFHCGPRSSLFTWLSGTPQRIGFEVTGRSWMYTTRVPRPRALRPRHSVETQWDLLLPLGIAPPDPETDPTEMPPDPVATAAVDRRLAQAGVQKDAPLVVVHVSAGNPFRRWPAESFVELVCRIVSNDSRRRVLLTSGPSDAGAAARIAELARARLDDAHRAGVLQVGEFDLAELRSLVGRASLYIGGDSGPFHVAGTTGVPVVGLYGPTLPVRSEPWRRPSFVSEAAEVGPLPCRPCDQRRCQPGDFRCLTGISAESVTQLAERALAAGGTAGMTARLGQNITGASAATAVTLRPALPNH